MKLFPEPNDSKEDGMSSLSRASNIKAGWRVSRAAWATTLLVIMLIALVITPALAEAEGEEASGGQDAESKALDSTATQWSFQLAYQGISDYHDDILDNGEPRPAGNNDYIQLRIVAPVPLKSFTLLPRLTFRHYENAAGESGMGNTELFALVNATSGVTAWPRRSSIRAASGSMACCSPSRGGEWIRWSCRQTKATPTHWGSPPS
jgi:hypothetical protein